MPGDDSPTSADTLRIELLGGFHVAVGERVVAPGAWRLRKARGLVKLLALAPGHRLHRERVQDLLWPDLPPDAAANNLHQTLHAARRALASADVAGTAALGWQSETLVLGTAGAVWTDVAAFEAAATTARRSGDPAEYGAALALYGGDLLPDDPYEDWAVGRREALRGLHLDLLLELAQREEARGELGRAREALARVIASEPAHEVAHVGLMRLHAQAGQRHQALRQYQQLEDALRRDLDAEPEPASRALYQDILAGRYASVPSRLPLTPSLATRDMPPVTRYTQSGDVNIAYQVLGDGPLDIVYVMGWISNLDYYWQEPRFAHFLRRLASFSRLMLFDKRGTGLSDRAVGLPTLEERMDDVRAVMDAVGSKRAAVVGVSEAGTMCLLFAATYPHRTAALVTIGSTSRWLWAPDHPWAPTAEERDRRSAEIVSGWGSPEWAARDLQRLAPSMAADEQFVQWFAAYARVSASPGAATAMMRMNYPIDVRHLLPELRVPTLILHRTADRTTKVEYGRYMAAQIPGAKYVELPGDDHLPWVGDADAMLDEIEGFLTGVQRGAETNRVLATILSVAIVGSLGRSGQSGDQHGREPAPAAHDVLRRDLDRFGGREIAVIGDSIVSTFEGPARAIRCARALVEATRALGLEVRAGLHTGECEVRGERVGGLAVDVSAQVAALAGPGEVLVSSTVKDLVVGSGIGFADRGLHTLQGLPEPWRVFAVEQASAS
jgi:DNA-binding SARP family transcriptional activator/pimeloyl-ACP methyl ester carboxylesterase